MYVWRMWHTNVCSRARGTEPHKDAEGTERVTQRGRVCPARYFCVDYPDFNPKEAPQVDQSDCQSISPTQGALDLWIARWHGVKQSREGAENGHG